MNRYKDLNTDEILTEDELRKEYEELKRNGETEAEDFKTYMSNCMYYNNGSLEPLASDWIIHTRQRDVAQKIACKDMPYDKVLDIIQKWKVFEDWTSYEISNRPVDTDELAECVAKELGLW